MEHKFQLPDFINLEVSEFHISKLKKKHFETFTRILLCICRENNTMRHLPNSSK